MVCIILLTTSMVNKMKKSPFYHINEFLHKDKKNNIICHSEHKGEEVTAVNIGLLPYKALKRFFYQMKENETAEIFLFAAVFFYYIFKSWYIVFTSVFVTVILYYIKQNVRFNKIYHCMK